MNENQLQNNNYILYEHNQLSYNNIINMWETDDKVALIQATGTGKSYVISEIIKTYKNNKILILAPTNFILNQIKSINNNINVSYMTYSKLVRLNQEDIKKINKDLIILDEYHRCGAGKWGNSVRLLLKYNEGKKILGTTATPIRHLDNSRDMSEELFHGNIANKVSLNESIKKGILTKPIYVSALYSYDYEIENLKHKIINSKNNYREKELFLKKLNHVKNWSDINGLNIIFDKYVDKEMSNFIVFCKNEKHMQESKKLLTDAFIKSKINKKIEIYSILGRYGKNKNQKILDNFIKNKSNDIKLLFSIDLLNEGVHLKDVHGVILLRNTHSSIIYFQQIGRIMNVGAEKAPIIFDFVNNFKNIKSEDVLYNENIKNPDENKETLLLTDFFRIIDECKDFKEVLDEIETELFDSWESMYAQLINYNNEFKNCNVSYKNSKYIKLAKWCNKQRVLFNKDKLSELKIEKLNHLNFTWNLREFKWYVMYDALVDFYNINGHCRVLYNHPQYKKLNKWCVGQRLSFSNKTLSEEKIALLDKINFIWNVLDEVWDSMYDELKEYKKINGNVNVPRRYTENLKLSNWCQMQRSNYKLGIISENRITLLENINFVWDIEDNRWNEMYECYVRYNNKEVNMSSKEISSLKSWITRQRKAKKENKLSQNRIKKLNDLEFNWNPLNK